MKWTNQPQQCLCGKMNKKFTQESSRQDGYISPESRQLGKIQGKKGQLAFVNKTELFIESGLSGKAGSEQHLIRVKPQSRVAA